jgi:hypothetical protein
MACAAAVERADAEAMWILLIILLLAWAGLAVLGFVVKGLIWLAVLGIVLFVATVVIGMLRGAAATKK